MGYGGYGEKLLSHTDRNMFFLFCVIIHKIMLMVLRCKIIFSSCLVKKTEICIMRYKHDACVQRSSGLFVYRISLYSLNGDNDGVRH